MGFYLKCLEVLKYDFLEDFPNSHAEEMLEKNFNVKKKGAKELNDFRPISLVGNFYKLISKVLTERLKRVVDSLKLPI